MHEIIDLGIPVIDLCSASIIDDLKSACKTFGFFYIYNHEVTTVNEMFDESKKFFELSIDMKLESICNKYNMGYTTYMDETVNPSLQSCGDTKEGYYIGSMTQPEQNIWPNKNILPNWERIMKIYHSECCKLGKKLVALISQAADLSPNYFDQDFENPTAILRLLKYSTQQSHPEEGVYGTGPHTDYGMITILAVDGQPGLQIYLHDKWIDIPPIQNTFVVNLGDCLQRYTNNYFKSTLHRVIITTERERFSTAFFYEPNENCTVRCLPEFLTDMNGQPIEKAYEDVKYGDYLRNKYANTHTDYLRIS